LHQSAFPDQEENKIRLFIPEDLRSGENIFYAATFGDLAPEHYDLLVEWQPMRRSHNASACQRRRCGATPNGMHLYLLLLLRPIMVAKIRCVHWRHAAYDMKATHQSLLDPSSNFKRRSFWHEADAAMVVWKEVMHKQDSPHLPAVCCPKQLRRDGHAGR